MKLHLLALGLFALILSSCGDDNLGAGTGEFRTVLVYATPPSARLESDVLTGNTCIGTTSSGGTYATDTAEFTLTSKAYEGFSTPLNLRVDSVTVTYTPANSGTPAISDFPVAFSGMLTPGNLTVPVPVFPEKTKFTLATSTLSPCSTQLYEYYITVNFKLTEIGTGVTKTIPATMNVSIADRTS